MILTSSVTKGSADMAKQTTVKLNRSAEITFSHMDNEVLIDRGDDYSAHYDNVTPSSKARLKWICAHGEQENRGYFEMYTLDATPDDSAPAPMNKDADNDIHAQAAICEHGIKHAHCGICTPDGGFIRTAQAAPDEPASGDVGAGDTFPIGDESDLVYNALVVLNDIGSPSQERMATNAQTALATLTDKADALTAELAALRAERDSLLAALGIAQTVIGDVLAMRTVTVSQVLEPAYAVGYSAALGEVKNILREVNIDTDN